MSSTRRVRAVRGVAAASAATFVALMSHLLGGGDVPGLLGIAVPWVLSLPLCMMLAGRRLSLWRLAVSVTVSQVLFHLLFVLGASSAGAVPVGNPHAGHGAQTADMVMTLPGPAPHAAAMHGDPTMWLWHGIAALITIAAIYRGERTLAQLRELGQQMGLWLRRRLVPHADVIPSLPPRRKLIGDWSAAPLSAGPELTPWRRRGPPSLSLV